MKIRQNKKQTVFFAIFLLAVFALFFWFTAFDARKIPHEDSALLDVPLFYWIFRSLTAVCAVILALSELYFVKELFSDNPLIEICDAYFFDKSSVISYGKIEWADMARVYYRGGFLNIDFKDPDAYLKRMNALQRFLIRVNRKMGYGHACISVQRFKKDAKLFLEEFNKRMPIQ